MHGKRQTHSLAAWRCLDEALKNSANASQHNAYRKGRVKSVSHMVRRLGARTKEKDGPRHTPAPAEMSRGGS